ncbi:ATPase [Phenylobacterium montanum]|uniref:ATPase n=1 Tax=Phenylobacterium montanum TaxID=2823693 RepID=A0A975G4U1_9CAUL|nr:ATPase [Caulobacter sp. S6]
MQLVLAAVAAVVASSGAARAEVVDVQPNGFEVRHALHLAVPPDKAYAALVDIGRWWSPDHTFSGDSANLSIEPKAGGCFCEALKDGGSVAHMRVVFVAPGKMLRLEGALGPLQTLGVTGHLAFALKPQDGGADLVLTYDVGGYAKDGFAGWATPVDHVLGLQMARLKAYAETGKP